MWLGGLLTCLVCLIAGVQSASAATFTDPAPLSGSSQPLSSEPPAKWSRYPATIPVSGLEGTITKVKVGLVDWLQGDTQYTDVLLESPDGKRVKLASDAGTYAPGVQAADHVTVIFDQEAEEAAPPGGGAAGAHPFGAPNSTVTLQPADYGGYVDNFPDLPPSADTAPASLTPLVGDQPNGEWKLYMTFNYSFGQQTGSLAGGWWVDVATTGPPPPPPPDLTSPVVSRVSTDGERFRAAGKGGPVGKSGAVIGYRLSESASVAFDLYRLLPGHKVKGKCYRNIKRRKNRGDRCTVVKAIPGTFGVNAVVGDNTFRFTGRLNGRKLKPGRYRLTGVATDPTGNRSLPFRAGVTVLKPRPKFKPTPMS